MSTQWAHNDYHSSWPSLENEDEWAQHWWAQMALSQGLEFMVSTNHELSAFPLGDVIVYSKSWALLVRSHPFLTLDALPFNQWCPCSKRETAQFGQVPPVPVCETDNTAHLLQVCGETPLICAKRQLPSLGVPSPGPLASWTGSRPFISTPGVSPGEARSLTPGPHACGPKGSPQQLLDLGCC